MAGSIPQDTAGLLARSRAGDDGAAAALVPVIYDELRGLARAYLDREAPDHTLQPTALVHEAFLRLMRNSRPDCRDRTHFFRTAAQVMRQILVDHARARRAAKRGGQQQQITLHEGVAVTADRQIDVLDLDDALQELTQLNQRHGQIVELRFFAGLTIDEAASALDVSTSTVEQDWTIARAWLRRRLTW